MLSLLFWWNHEMYFQMVHSNTGVGNLWPTSNSYAARQTSRGKKSDETLPYMIYVGRYHLPVKRPLDSLFWHKSYNDPVSYCSPHLKTLFFSKLECKISNFLRASRAYRKFLSIFSLKWQIFTQICPSLHQKSPGFCGSHNQWPFFSTESYTKCPLFVLH